MNDDKATDKIGNIRLYNGDCMDVICNLNVDNPIIVTDPPFNVGYKYSSYKDKMDDGEYYEWISNVCTSIGSPFVVIHYPESLYRLSFQTGVFPNRVISWVYNSNTSRQHRDIAFFGVNPDFSKVRQPYKNPNDKRIKERIQNGICGGKMYDWIDADQVKNVSKGKQGINHPCVMPLKVMIAIIGMLPDDCTIIDPFMGSGTTGIACIELGRKFIGIEIDKEYYDNALKRLKEFEFEKLSRLF